MLLEIRRMPCALARSPEEALRRLDADAERTGQEIGVVVQDMSFSPEATSGDLLKRMVDRQFSEVDLRRMLEYATGLRDDVVEGRWTVETRHESTPGKSS
ncbi:MAG TPA: hypothetical protein VFC23_03890 [Thermoanaerobaculia bacterium]|nr:hypothetical protein [Thermoanaerobaculia bacterium]